MSQPNFDKKVAAKGEHRYKTTQNIYMKQNGNKEKNMVTAKSSN